MRRILLLLVLVSSLAGCAGKGGGAAGSWQRSVDGMSGLIGPLVTVPDHLQVENAEKRGDEFDVNAFFTVLDRLSLEPGYVLDYVYCFDGFGGYPMLYVRPESATPYRTCSEYLNALHAAGSDDRYDYLNDIHVDGTAEGFFQLVVLRTMGNQFYLHWHAGYNDALIVCNRMALEDLLTVGQGSRVPEEVADQARELDLTPVVEMGEDTVTVRVVIFTNWGGFIRLNYTIRRDFPHEFVDFSEATLVPYDCGIQF
jgi:hypothetical protein